MEGTEKMDDDVNVSPSDSSEAEENQVDDDGNVVDQEDEQHHEILPRSEVANASSDDVMASPPTTENAADQGETNDDADQNDHSTATNVSATTTNNKIMTQRLDRELALSNTHRLQLQSHWRRVLSNEKFQQLHDDIPQLIKYHDENIVRKKDVITALTKEIHHLQELYRDAMVANMNRVEDLIALHDEGRVKLEDDFRSNVSKLQAQFRLDVDEIHSRYEKEKEEVRRYIQRRTENDERKIDTLRQDHQQELEEIKNRNLENINGLRYVMDSRLEGLTEQVERTNSEFVQNTDGTKAAYEKLKAKDDRIRREVEWRMRRANKLREEIQRFQLIARQEEAQIADRRAELLARKARAISRWNATQEELTRFRDERHRKLVDLIRRANERKEELRRQCEAAERVKKIALACRRYESKREEQGCDSSGDAAEEGKPLSGGDDGGDNEADEQQQRSFIIKCMGRLGDTSHRFWDKYNMARLDVLVLERKLRRLKQRETDLNKKLKMYQDGITVNDDVLKDRNPLLIINGRMNQEGGQGIVYDVNNKGRHHGGGGGKKKRGVMTRRLTVVDGNHFVATNNNMLGVV